MMHLRRLGFGFGFAVLCVIAVSVVALNGSMGRRRAPEPAPPHQGFTDSFPEQMWSNCRLELKDVKDVKNSDLSILEDFFGDPTNMLKTRLSGGESMREAISLLSPELKHILLECLSKNNFLFCAPEDNYSMRNEYVEYLEILFGRSPVSGRHLGQDLHIVSHALVQASPVSPTFAPTPGPEVQLPSHGPTLSHTRGVAKSSAPEYVTPDPDPNDFLQPTSPDRPEEPLDMGHGSAPTKNQNNNTNQNDSKKTIIVAVVVTAAGTSLVAAFVFCCCFGCFRNKDDLENGQKDDRPLLALSMSEFSGSSHKSFGLASPITNDKFGSLSFNSDPGQNGHVVFLDNSVETPPSIAHSRVSSSVGLSTAPNDALVSIPASSSASPAERSDALNVPPAPKPPPPPMMPPLVKKVASPPVPPPPVPNLKMGPRPPPPPKSTLPPRVSKPSPPPPRNFGNAQQLDADSDNSAPRTKLKPFFWDKVTANSDQAMVWHEIKSGSFQFNEEMIETLFGYSMTDKNKTEGKKESTSRDHSPQYILILEPKKSQNLAISLKALNVKIEEVSEAILEGNELPAELLQSLLRMAPTTDEELKLRLYTGDRLLLGPAERFLKAMVDIPFAFKRMDALLFMSSLEEDATGIKESFATLEVASRELRSSRLFLKLLEAVLKTGNRMNDGTFRGGAQAFKLDTLLKLSDVKGTDGKTTLLHFVVQEIIRSEGVRAVRMARESGSLSSLTSINSDDFVEDSPQETVDHYRNLGLVVVSGLSSELENVKKAAGLDADALTSTVATLGHRLVRTKEFLNTDMKTSGEESGFHNVLRCFVEHAEADITSLLVEEKRVRSLVKSTTDYFHGKAGKDEGLRLFVIVRDFLGMLDKVCREVKESSKKVQRLVKVRESPKMSPVQDPRQLLFPAIRVKRTDNSSSDEE